MNINYQSLDAFRIEEFVIKGLHSIIRFNYATLLQQYWSCVKSIISPEDCEPCLLVAMYQRPASDYITIVNCD